MTQTTLKIVSAIFFLFSLWLGLIYIFELPPYILPSPITVISRFWDSKIFLFDHALITFLEILIGFLVGSFLGIVTALLMAHFPFFRNCIHPLLLITQAIPVFVIAPLIILWCGYGMASKILMITLLLYFSITSNFYDGLKRTPSHFLEMARLMKSSRLRILLFIQFPAALPQLFSGIRLGAAFAPIAALIGEWVGASKGLGFLILDSFTRVDMPLLFAALFILILFTLGFYHLIHFLTRKATPWIQEQKI